MDNLNRQSTFLALPDLQWVEVEAAEVEEDVGAAACKVAKPPRYGRAALLGRPGFTGVP